MERRSKSEYFSRMGRPPKSNLPEELKSALFAIGGNIRMHRERLGMSQTELARRAKISVTTLNELERRAFRDIRLSTLVAVAQILKLPVVGLFFQSDLNFLESSDRAQLLKASDSIFQITKKLGLRPKKKS